MAPQKIPEEIEINDAWLESIRELVPDAPSTKPEAVRKILMISVSTGYKHWVIPHTAELMRILSEKSGAFELEETSDPESFVPENLSRFDAVCMNNTCSADPERDLFFDILGDKSRADVLRANLLQFISNGGGLVSLHGGIIAFNGCSDWGEMHGGHFDYHPQQQELTLTAVEPRHPLTLALGGKPFVHIDEPYLFDEAYNDMHFRPLLEIDTSNLVMNEGQSRPAVACYAAWIKKYGEGRVFYCSPSHNAQSFNDSRLIRFMLDGIQYALGDFACDDSPIR